MKKLPNLMILCCVVVLVNGCYLIKQGIYLFRYNSSAKSVEHLLKDPHTEEKIRSFLKLVQEIRTFAIDWIGLENNRNYTRMVEIDKDYIAVFVAAAQRLSFEQYKWCFPILGCIPYKGYFQIDDAKREADKLAGLGYDVDISEVDAFSTLGFFSDPLYSYMAKYNVFSLASLIIHEQTHATLYLKDQAQFNEELATFIGNKGALEFVKRKYGEESEVYRNAVATGKDREYYRAIMKKLVSDLDLVYKSDASSELKLQRKQQTIDDFRLNIKNSYDTIFKTPYYRNIESMKINNASLAVWMTYTCDLSIFEQLYSKKRNNLHDTMEYIKKLKKLKGDPKSHIRKFVNVQ
ncbi:MAG TPA: aminopeptidase [Chitinispirillaceae bacterium]|nr:aminopeptidase [Chitinispirillaceae bacterium]